MKKIISITTTVLIICLVSVLLISGTTLTASALTEGDYTYTVSNGKATIKKYNGSGGDVVIPDTLGGYPVTSIGNFAFADCDSLTSVVIGDGVTSIGEKAFRGCTSLTSVEIGDSVTTIGEWAFSNCISLTSVYITDIASWCGIYFDSYRGDYSSNPLCYADNLYLNGELITDLVIPEGVTTIPYYAFSCNNITSVTIPDSVTSIGDGAFSNCISLTSVYITDIASWCGIYFDSYHGDYYSNPMPYGAKLYIKGSRKPITDLVIPDSVTKINAYAFYSCDSLTSVEIPDSVTTIGNFAFAWCDSLTSVYITDIASWCNIEFSDSYSNPLYYADNLYLNGELITDLVIPDSVTTIGFRAFSNCTSLTSVEIPDSVTSIGDYAFSGCSGLTSVYITDIASWCGIQFGSNPLGYAGNLYLNGELITDLVIPEGVTTISNRAFYNCSSLTSVVIGDSVTSIGNSAFSYCASLTSVVIPDSVTSIGGYAFSDCDSLTSVTIEGNTAINKNTFSNCSKLTNLVFGENATTISNQFSSLTTIKTLTLTKNLVDMEYNLFINCPLETVYFRGTRAEWDSMVYAQDEQFENVNIIFLCYHTYDNYCDTTCNGCGEEREITHSFEWVVDAEATCGIDGSKHEECTVCGAKQNENTVIEATGEHSYDNTCDEVCNVCEQTREITHSFEWIIDAENNCGVDGSKHEECTVCGVKQNENTVIEATGEHTFEWIIDAENNCGIDGSKYEECTVCGAKQNENTVIEATGEHTFEWIIDAENNCGVAGSKHEECTVCGAKQNENTVIEATGEHTFEWIIDSENNCGVDGSKHEECTVCGAKQNENTVIEATGEHTYDNSEDLICNVCGYERPPYVPGDLDGVEGVTDSDAVFLLFHTYFPEDYPIDQPVDYDGDGSITDSDAVYLLFHTYFPDDYPLYATTPAMTVMETIETKKDEE